MQVFALALGLASPGPAPHTPALRYWGEAPDAAGAGRLAYQGRVYRVRVGDEIPGWGRVQAVTAEALVVRHVLTPAEKESRAAAGALVVDVQDLRLPRTAPQLACAGECPEPAP
jgi:hypothetical protein